MISITKVVISHEIPKLWSGGGSRTVSNKMTHKGFLAAFQVSMLFMKFCIDGTPQGFWQPTEDENMPSYRGSLSKDCNLLPLLLQMTFESPTNCNCLFHIFGLSMMPNVVKETAVRMALNIREKKHSVYPNWPNIATKFAKRGTL